MIYFIVGNDPKWMSLTIEEELKKFHLENLNPIVYNGKDLSFSFDDLILEATTYSLFEEKKVIVMKNLMGFNTKKVMDDIDFSQLEKLLKNPPLDVHIFFTLDTSKPDGKRKITKLFKKHALWIEEPTLSDGDIGALINQRIQKLKLEIDKDAIDTIKKLCRTFDDVISAFAKLQLFDGKITNQVVSKLIVDNRESIIYQLSEALLKQDATKVFSVYYALLDQQIEPIQIIYHLAGKYRQYFQLLSLLNLNKSPSDISKQLRMSEKQVYFIANNHRGLISPKECLHHLRLLADLDQDAKRGKVDFKTGLERFMIEVLA